MDLKAVFSEIIGELPWIENTRLIVGPLASREAVKDELLKQTPVIPSWAVGTFSDLANELVGPAKPLSLASQCDALEKIATSPFLKERVPTLCAHLKARPVAMKVARFITNLEKFYVQDEDLDAVTEYFLTKDPSLGAFVAVVRQLWSQGELSPWGEGYNLRRAVQNLPEKLPQSIWLWGFHEFTPLEEALIEKLALRGVKIRMLVPDRQIEAFTPRCQNIGIEAVAITEVKSAQQVWEPHSVWDELEFLRDELVALRSKNIPFDQIAVFVPGDDLYKRLVRQKLYDWNVPIHDPTLSGGWKDKPRWMWWRDLLRTVASGLKLEDVRAWLGPGEGRHELFELAFKKGVHGSAGQWAKLNSDLPELKILIEGVKIFSRAVAPSKFLEAVQNFIPFVETTLALTPESRLTFETTLLLDFAHHLCEERPYLESYRARLPKYVALFEEYLESKARTESLRAIDGIKFIGHGVWLPHNVKHAYVLGAGQITRARFTSDLWDWEGVEVRRAWEKLHFGLPWAERVARDETFLRHGLESHTNVVFSATEYDLGGKPLAKSSTYLLIKGEHELSRVGGHEAVGWKVSSESEESRAKIEVLLPEIARQSFGEKPMRVSAFEDYLKCPFFYFARHILKLDQEDELGLDPDGRARGNTLHKVLSRFIQEELDGKPLGEIEDARRRLFEMVDEEVRSGGLTGMFRHEPLVKKAVTVIKAYAAKWLEWEFENRKKHPELKPFFVEKAIQYNLVEGLKLSGRPDRVDSDGSHSVVIDYKSGAAPFIGRELREGLGAQLLMYSNAVKNEHGLEPAAAYYIGLGRAIDASKGVFLDAHNKKLHTTHARNSGLVKSDYPTMFEQVQQNWLRAADQLKKGDFSPQPSRKTDCDRCLYQPICGFEPPLEEDQGE